MLKEPFLELGLFQGDPSPSALLPPQPNHFAKTALVSEPQIYWAPSSLAQCAGQPASPWARSPSWTPLDPVWILPSGLALELGPAYAPSWLHINGFGDTDTQGFSLDRSSGCGPLTFLLFSLCLGRVSDNTNPVSTPDGALPGDDLPARAQKGLTSPSRHQVLQPTFSYLLDPPSPCMSPFTPSNSQGSFQKHNETTFPSCSLPR